MGDHGGGVPGNFLRPQYEEPQYVLPLPSQYAGSRLERVFSTIQPLVAHSNELPFRSYARRFFPQNSSSPLSPHLVSRSSLGRPQILEALREQSQASNNTTSNPSSMALGVAQPSNVADVDTAVSGIQNVVINIDLEPYNNSNERGGSSTNANSAPNQSPNEDNNPRGRLSIDSQRVEDFLGRNQDLRISIMNIWQYLVFICIVLVKLLLDKITSIFVLVCLSLIFVMGDKVVRKKATYQSRSFKSIIAIIFIMPLSIYLLYRTYNKENFFYSALLLFPDYNLVTLGDLLWIIIITDLVLKIVTVMMKSVIVLLPKSLLKQRSKANVYALLERISLLYRSLATIQPWLSYFLDGYSGPKKIFGVFLSGFYMLCKGPEIILRIKDLRAIVIKFIFCSGYGSNPSQKELGDAGSRCPICHDEFNSPLRLNCSHIFCESCVLTWFTREKTCPMCRTNIIAEDPAYRDGSTSYLPQIY